MVCIMAGGGGTRLFPLSQTGEGKLPKQFLAIIDHETLLQKTISRTPESFAITVIPEERFSDTVLEQAEQTGREVSVLAEPFGCNTAAAMLYACAYEQSILGNLIRCCVSSRQITRWTVISTESFCTLLRILHTVLTG